MSTKEYTVADDGDDYHDVIAPDGKVIACVLRGGGFDDEETNREAEAASLATARRIAELLTLHGEK